MCLESSLDNMALGIIVHNQTYRWLEDMSEEAIEKRTADDQAARILSVLLIGLFGLSCFISIGLLVAQGLFFQLFHLRFWVEPSLEALSLLFSGLFGTFWFSHTFQTTRRVVHMPKLTLREILPRVEDVAVSKNEINVADLFDASAHEAVEGAFSLANKFGHKQLEPLHLFLGAMDE